MIISGFDRVEKTLWEREKMLVTSISPLSHNVFEKASFPTLQKVSSYENGLNSRLQMQDNTGFQHFLLLQKCFQKGC